MGVNVYGSVSVGSIWIDVELRKIRKTMKEKRKKRRRKQKWEKENKSNGESLHESISK